MYLLTQNHGRNAEGFIKCFKQSKFYTKNRVRHEKNQLNKGETVWTSTDKMSRDVIDVTEGKLNYENSRMYVGISWSQADRPTMQDAFTVILNTEEDPGLDFLSVFDGHGTDGCAIAAFAAQNLHTLVMKNRKHKPMTEAIELGFQGVDDLLRKQWKEAHENLSEVNGEDRHACFADGGTTAAALWLRRNKIYCAHIGDSRVILSRRGRAIPLTRDHKPQVNEEHRRIVRAGGKVINGRVNGLLGVSRSFGDFAFKADRGSVPSKQVVTVTPAQCQQRVEVGEFVVLASDGVWDIMSSQAVVDFIRHKLKRYVPVQTICSELLEECNSPFNLFRALDTRDNMTVILALFK
jgi:serine/threonine protein phosphatase PrpC